MTRKRSIATARRARPQRLRGNPASDLTLSLAGLVEALSAEVAQLLGRPVDALMATNLFHHAHPADELALSSALNRARETGLAVATIRCRHASGQWVWLEGTFTADKSSVRVMVRDVTSSRRLEEELLIAQKMEAVSRLAGGVAHDFNNLLSVISSAAALLAEETTPGSTSAELAQEVQRACRRATDLTRQLLAFSGRQIFQPVPVDLHDIVETISARLTSQLPPDVTVSLALDSASAVVLADAVHLEQVLMNLALNARDAMPQGGKLTLGTRQFEVRPEAALSFGLPPGSWFALTVTDTGVGMEPSVQAHLFEPFFTTKPRGKGNGLGLATAWGFVRQFDGQIRVESQPGKGSTFSVLLPAREGTPLPQSEVDGGGAGGRTVLLVEDDSAVRWIAAAVLTRGGYHVLQADGGAQAIALAKSTPVIDLLLSDVVMPGMSGPEVASAVRMLKPTIKVLFMSGFTNDAELRANIRDATVHFLPKPFSPETLLQHVRMVLRGEAAQAQGRPG